MNDADKPAFLTLIASVYAYYRHDCSEFTLDLWWQGCQPYELAQVRHALNVHARNPERGHFCPMLNDVVRVLEGTGNERSLGAWGKLISAIADVGQYQDVAFDDPAIHAAVADLGGWPSVCRRCDDKNRSYLQHEFCKLHEAYAKRGEFDYPRWLTGDRDPDERYLARGLNPPAPVMRGALADVRRVIDGGRRRAQRAIELHVASALVHRSLPHVAA